MALADALIDLFARTDSSGRVPGDLARALVGKLANASAAERAALMHEPEIHLGRFEELSSAARRGM
ncbi:MAG: hypothetical protein ACRETY_00655, partial [Steroidobacteraceae bacterium]